jgi:hypothetical protein
VLLEQVQQTLQETWSRYEYEICQKRGHDLRGLLERKWRPCRWCGMWIRTMRKIEEHEEEPPPEEQDQLTNYDS